MTMAEDILMTVKDVAIFLRVEERTVYRWVELGRIKPLRMGRTIRFSKSNLLRAMEKSRYSQPATGDDPMMG